MKIRKLFYLLIASTLLLGLNIKTVRAANSSDWRAGRITDLRMFTDKASMSIADIQKFLDQKVPNCDINGAKVSELGGGTRAQYGSAHNNPTPFTCLKDYYEVPKLVPGPEVPANNYGGKPIPTGAKSAANLIFDAAQTYNISPKVLLVTIQKESAGPLITDDWPFLSQYTYAMGAHCPDSGPNGSANCDSNYSGFSIQIAESAALFRFYLDNMSQPWWPYKKVGYNNIQFNPSVACGSTSVYIENPATAALYTYTPYQPNQAALNNLYGTGDSCSAYGNRNFWRMFTDWFGSTITVNMTGSPASVSWAVNRVDSFVRGSDGSLWQKWFDAAGGWRDWGSLNVPIASSPAVSSWDEGRLDVFYVNNGNDLGHYWFDGVSWQGPESLGRPAPNVTISGAPTTVSWGKDRVDVFVRGSDGSLWQKWFDAAGGWRDWNKLGGNIASSPTVSSWASGRLDIFANGTGGDLQHYWFDDSGWHGWESLGFSTGGLATSTAPSAISWSKDRIDVFSRSNDGKVWQKWFDAAGGWRDWNKLGGNIASSPTVSSWASGRLDIFANGTGGDLQHYWFDDSGWHGWESLGNIN